MSNLFFTTCGELIENNTIEHMSNSDLNLKGNLNLDGNIKANDFIGKDGKSILSQIGGATQLTNNIGSRLNVNSGNDHIAINAQSNTDSHIQLKTKNDDNKNVYLINRDGHFRLHQHGIGDMFGVNKDGHHYIRHTGDHVTHIEGDGNNPYISLGKTGTWGGKKLYIQNVDAHSDIPTFRVGVHDKGPMMDMSEKYGARWKRKDNRWTHFDWEDGKNYIRGDTQHDNSLNVGGNLNAGKTVVNSGNDHIPIIAASNTDSHIQLKTKNDDNKNVYLINRDGHFRLHQHGIGDVFGVNKDGHTYINSGNNHLGLNVQSNTDSHILLRTKNDANKDLYLINRDGHFRLHQGGVGDVFGVNKDGHTYINSGNNHLGLNVQSNTDSHILLRTKNDANKDLYLINRDGHFRLHQGGVGDMFGVNKDGHHYVRHTGDHVAHLEGDGNNPYISLGKTGTWDRRKFYIQNVDAHTDNPTLRIGTHGGFHFMDMSKSHGVRWQRKDGRWTHLDWEDGKNYIRGNTQHDGDINVDGSSYARKNNYLYYPENAKIYQEVFDALKDGTLAKSGNPAHWDQTSYAVNPWEGRKIIRLGGIDQTIKFPNGGMITVPNGYNVLWVRILGDRWACVQVHNEKGENLGNFSGGYNKLNRYAPDGGTSDTFWHVHEWMAIPVPGPGKYILCAGNNVNDGGRDLWISGIAFSTNPWNHAYNSAVAYHWAVNGGTNLGWATHDWNNAPIAMIEAKSNTMIVPCVYSGKDKLLYLVEHNNNWDGMMHKEIKVEGQVVERFRATWEHPLARHHNSKFYNRFVAARIPANLTNKRFLKVEINNAGVNHNIYIREAGTIDMY
jgi:hypothetical protein